VTVLVDSSVLLDVATEDPLWQHWSAGSLATLGASDILTINPIIYAEVSVGFARIEDVEHALPASLFRRENLPYEAAFLAGKAFLSYRRLGGQRTSPLPDFYVGAHAAVTGYRVLTRDPSRIRHYFPTVDLICP